MGHRPQRNHPRDVIILSPTSRPQPKDVTQDPRPSCQNPWRPQGTTDRVTMTRDWGLTLPVVQLRQKQQASNHSPVPHSEMSSQVPSSDRVPTSAFLPTESPQVPSTTSGRHVGGLTVGHHVPAGSEPEVTTRGEDSGLAPGSEEQARQGT